MDERQDGFDRELDAALKRYGQAPYREGLDQRILQRVSENITYRRRFRTLLPIMLAVTAIACCFLRIEISNLFLTPRFVENPARAQVQSGAFKRQPRQPHQGSFSVSTIRTKRRKRRREEPKLSRFPSPLPMNREEQALLHLVEYQQKNRPRKQMFAGGPIQPIQITAVEIEPL